MKKQIKSTKKTKKKGNFRDHQEKLLQDLKNPELASAYLNIALMDEDPGMFLIALKNVHEALGIPIEELEKSTKTQSKSFSYKRNKVLSELVSLIRSGHASLSLIPAKK